MDKIQWEIDVPIFKNRLILKGIGLALGIPFGAVIVLIFALSGGDIVHTDAKYALFMIGLLLGLSFIAIMLIYGGKYAAGFILDESGVTNYTQSKQARKNKVINTMLIVAGTITGKPGAVGTGMIAQSRENMHIRWKNIRKVKFYPRQSTILIKGGFAETIGIFCTKDNYTLVEAAIRQMTNRAATPMRHKTDTAL